MRITTKLTISMITGAVVEHEWYEYDGPVELTCGATGGQRAVAQSQTTLFNDLANNAKSEFSSSSSVFNDLVNAFSPIVAAGPNSPGYSAPELSALKSDAITNTGQAYKNASEAVREASSAVGGGNMALPSGAEVGAETQIANQGAAQTASALNKIDLANYDQGRSNFFQAASDLAGAPSVFNPANSAGGVATTSGEAAANTENQIAQENNSWVSAVTGALGGIPGGVVSGGMSNLGRGAGFFGQTAVAPGQ